MLVSGFLRCVWIWVRVIDIYIYIVGIYLYLILGSFHLFLLINSLRDGMWQRTEEKM